VKRLFALLLGLSLTAAAACSAPPKGALILAVSTDMQTPKDIDIVSVFVSTNGTPKFDFLGRVQPDGTLSLPATLAVVEPDDPQAEVRVRVVGFQGQRARVLRDVRTTVPHQRTALLRLPLSYLDDGSARGTLPAQYVPSAASGVPDGETKFDPTDLTVIQSSCALDGSQTSVAGTCADSSLSASKLPDYADEGVFGDGGTEARPSCFSVQECFASSAAVAPSMITTAADGSCSFALSATQAGRKWNCALATTDGTGACVGGQCLVPLESDPGEGFTITPGVSVVMVPGVCKKLEAGAKLVLNKTSCATKVEAAPVCEPTTAAEVAEAGTGSTLDAASDGADDVAMDAPPEDGGSEATMPGADATVSDAAVEPDTGTAGDAGAG
jgi:hypothetical protein